MRKHLWWIKPCLIGTLVALTLSTCKTSEKLGPAEANEFPNETVVVSEGDSSQPSYSPDGTRLLFVSRGRRGHLHAQIYEKIMATGAERRITFQNGSTAAPRFHPREDWILYSSSTDELKEDPPRLREQIQDSKFPSAYAEPFELYVHSLKGLEINRMTRHEGFDGDARFSPNGNEIIWTRVQDGKLSVVSAQRGSTAVKIVKGPMGNASQFAASADGKMKIWLEWDEGFVTSHIRLVGKKEVREIASEIPGYKTDLTFSPDGKHILWAQVSSKSSKYEIWDFEIETACVRKLVSAPGDRRHPTVSPDMKSLTFTSWRKDRSRIAQVSYLPSAGPCRPAL